jgi:hypothetical protein
VTARRGKGRATTILIEACHEILAEIQPASVRAVCYRLFTMGLIPDMSKASTNKVSKQLVYAREKGIVPWEWVVDETREIERAGLWSNPDAIVDAAVAGYRRDHWQDQRRRVEVWSEKGTVRGTLAPVLKEFGVALRVMHGYGSATSIKQAADDSLRTDKFSWALYVGDWDPSGLHMSEVDLPERIERYGGYIQMRRVALVEDDLDDLPNFDADTKRGDPRYRWFVENYGDECWELDAMSPVKLREKVRTAIRELIDGDAWARALEVERAEVESMRVFHRAWTDRISGQASKWPAG